QEPMGAGMTGMPDALSSTDPLGVAAVNPGGGTPDLSTATVLDLSYAVKFPVGFDFGKGGMLPGLYGGAQGQSSAGQHGDGWSTRFAWSANNGALVAYTKTNTGYGQLLGQGAWTFAADGAWHQLEQRLDRNAGSVTLFYDHQQVYTGPIDGLQDIPVAGIL